MTQFLDELRLMQFDVILDNPRALRRLARLRVNPFDDSASPLRASSFDTAKIDPALLGGV